MSTAWWMISGGGLLVYSIAALGYYLWRPDQQWLRMTVSPYVDALIVTLATVALARPSYPIWIGYLIVVSGLSAVHTTRYVGLLAVWAVVAYWMGIAALDLTGRANPSWQIATVVSIMLIFTAIDSVFSVVHTVAGGRLPFTLAISHLTSDFERACEYLAPSLAIARSHLAHVGSLGHPLGTLFGSAGSLPASRSSPSRKPSPS